MAASSRLTDSRSTCHCKTTILGQHLQMATAAAASMIAENQLLHPKGHWPLCKHPLINIYCHQQDRILKRLLCLPHGIHTRDTTQAAASGMFLQTAMVKNVPALLQSGDVTPISS